ncbi:MAG: class I SAM-dependent methyltransferase, partial [Actinomycetota bacterium]|nr:class I SAM-dependent methyltransferase [Actinomycetota bacterium]
LPGIPAENYWYRRHVAAYRWAARHCGPGRVIDAGTGEGFGASMLARRSRVTGIELDAAAAAHAASRYRDISVARADLCRFPIRDASQDAIVCLQVLEHLHCAGDFVEACARALRPGGRLLVSTPNRKTFPDGLNPFHVHEYVASELEGLLQTRFREVRILGLHHRFPLRSLDTVLSEPLQQRLVRRPYEDLPLWLRAMLRSVTAPDFRVTGAPDRALDLLAVATGTIQA